MGHRAGNRRQADCLCRCSRHYALGPPHGRSAGLGAPVGRGSIEPLKLLIPPLLPPYGWAVPIRPPTGGRFHGWRRDRKFSGVNEPAARRASHRKLSDPNEILVC